MKFGNLNVQSHLGDLDVEEDIIRMDCKETDEDSSEPVSGFYEN